MATRNFIAAELVVALCGLVVVVLNVASWEGGPEQTAALVLAFLMCAAGLGAAWFGLKARRRAAASPDR